MIERIARKQPKAHKELDRMKPFKYEQLGTPDDPCYGHYSLKAKECSKCGDCEVCSIVTSQKIFTQIGSEERKRSFKDMDEAKLISEQNTEIATMLLKRAKKNAEKWCSISKIIPTLIGKYNLNQEGTDDEYMRQRVIKTVQETKGLKINKEQTKYRYA